MHSCWALEHDLQGVSLVHLVFRFLHLMHLLHYLSQVRVEFMSKGAYANTARLGGSVDAGDREDWASREGTPTADISRRMVVEISIKAGDGQSNDVMMYMSLEAGKQYRDIHVESRIPAKLPG